MTNKQPSILAKRDAQFFKALGNVSRAQIVRTLATEGEKSVNQLNKYVGISQPSLSQHLLKLKNAGIVKARRDSREIYYSIDDKARVELALAVNGGK